jgi:hypothetical protein
MMHNPNTWSIHNYSIVEDLAQELCAMLVLEILQSCSVQQKSLLSSIGGVDPLESSFMTFDSSQGTHRIPHQVTFHIIM